MAKDKGHEPYYSPILGKHFCHTCGLIYLRNKATQKEVRKPCKGKMNE